MKDTKGTLEQLIAEGQALAEKQTWVRKSYDELMDKLNEHLKGIPDMPETALRYVVHEWEEPVTGFRHKIRLALHFECDGYLALDERWEDEGQWYTEPLYRPDLDVMRAVGEKLGEALEYFLERIWERGIEHDQVIATLTELVAKLR